MNSNTPEALLAVAVEVAQAAGKLLLDHWRPTGASDELTSSIRTKTTRTDLVTAADQASESLITALLAEARPDDGFLGEETGHRPGTSAYTWVVDPLDGTINFVYSQPVFAVSIACTTTSGQTLAGVVHNPVIGETFAASAGGGASLNGQPLRLGSGPSLAQALVGTGFGYDSRRRLAQARLLPSVLPAVRDIRRGGSAALDLCWVAAGRLDGHFEAGLSPWDLAAGELVVREAGGQVCELAGLFDEEPTLVTVLAAAPDLCRELEGLLRAAGREA
jgi:myo-inositol-1(or 4)-monophosphatase